MAANLLLIPLRSHALNGLIIRPEQGFDLGKFPAESNRTATFTLFNTSSNALGIERVESCCAFLDPVIYDNTIAPGGNAPLDVIIDAHILNGPFNKHITLTTAGPDRQTAVLWIKGTAMPAISTPGPHVYAGHIALEQVWTTNLAVAVRNGLSGQLQAEAQSNAGLTANVSQTGGLLITVPPQREPLLWKGTVFLRIKDRRDLRPVSIHLEGCIGGSLHPQPRKLEVSGRNPQASLTLYRQYPAPPPGLPPPLQCDFPAIGIEEVFGDKGESTLKLTFPDEFMQRLKTENRIPIQLRAEGLVPAILTIEHARDPLRP